MIKDLIKKLQKAIDALEDLYSFKENENQKVAKKILSSVKKKKVHWTQTPKGRKIMSQRMKAFKNKQ